MGIKIAINGAAGRMGRRLMSLTCADEELELIAAIESVGNPVIGKAISELEPSANVSTAVMTALQGKIDVVVDFSAPEAIIGLLEQIASLNSALVIGTTGFDAEQEERINKASMLIPIVMAPNMSLGVNLLFKLAGEVASLLGEEYNIEIVEAHHNQKADAPSGTALGLAKSICEATNRSLEKDLVHGRSGKPEARTSKEIGMHAIRMGSVVGDHTVNFCSNSERIELSHHAQNRDVFVTGALRAAKWVCGKKPGLYTMQDVLFSKE